jgi:hypothetical protein
VSGHTPGPWHLDTMTSPGGKGKPDDVVLTVLSSADEGIAEVFWHWNHVRHQEEDRANARLIAAAPDLLNACLDAHELLDRVGDARKDRDLIDALAAAIEKATGGVGS